MAHSEPEYARQLSEAAVDMVASAIATRPVRVCITGRMQWPGTVVVKSNTLFLHEQAGLMDLLLMARVLRVAAPFIRCGRETAARGTVLDWVGCARQELADTLPGCRSLRNQLEGAFCPVVTWEDVQLDPLAGGGAGVREVTQISGLELGGEDYRSLLDSITRGELPLRHVEGLPWPVAEVNIRVRQSPRASACDTRLARARHSHRLQYYTRQYMECYVRHSEDEAEFREGPGTPIGGHISTKRLTEILIAPLRERPPRLFSRRLPGPTAESAPERHLWVVGLDLWAHAKGNGSALTADVPLSQLIAMDRLGIDGEVYAYQDRIADLPDGQTVYLNFRLLLKSRHEAWTGSVWRRIAEALYTDRCKDDGAVAYAPEHVRHLCNRFQKLALEGRYSGGSLRYLSHWSEAHAAIRNEASLLLAANRIDDQLDKIHADHSDLRWHDLFWIPTPLKRAGSRGRYVADMLSLND
jgi:hypothetical protein